MYHQLFWAAPRARGSSAWLLSTPTAVLNRPDLSNARKREILAFWMSDIHAVENSPALRRLPSGAVVTIDEIRKALLALDSQSSRGRRTAIGAPRTNRLRTRGSRGGYRFALYDRTGGDGDEGPPKHPAGAMRQAVYEATAADAGGRRALA